MRIIFYILLFISLSITAQTKMGMDSVTFKNKIKNANQIDLNKFLTFWIKPNNHGPGQPGLRDFFSDSIYTFFIRSGKSYKIQKNEIAKIDYKKINGDSLIHQFSNNVIPQKDIVKSENCGTAIVTPMYKCKYIDNTFIEISCHYKIVCELIPVLDKTYTALYNLQNKTYKIIDTPPVINRK